MTAAILLLGLGLALVVAEILFPSFGVLSVLATTAIVAAILMAFREDTGTGIQFLVATGVLVPVAIMAGLKIFPRTPIGKRMVASGLSFESRAATDERDLDLVGEKGVIEGPCRPSGMARIGDRRVDVVTRGGFLEKGDEIRVIEVQGNRVVVARMEE
jgi:membrane-bound ClpP family serine protease